ncbi:chaperone NapD [Rhizobacter sp. P5_C2]
MRRTMLPVAAAPSSGPAELHIASLVVHSSPSRAPALAVTLAELPGAVIHAVTDRGKLVITLEASSAGDMIGLVQTIQRTDGVLSAALVYQHADTLESMNEELPDADRPQGLH